MIRAVLDTNTLVSAVINIESSVASEIYQNFKEKHFLLVISPQILAEIYDVLHRDKVMKFHHRSTEELQEVINELTSISYVVPGKTKVMVVRDPDDNKIVSAALEGQVDYIVSRDRDLLDLKEYKRIEIITPEEFMGVLRSKN